MKRSYILIILSFFSLITFSQRNCPTVIDLAQIQIEDPARYQRFIDLENFTANSCCCWRPRQQHIKEVIV